MRVNHSHSDEFCLWTIFRQEDKQLFEIPPSQNSMMINVVLLHALVDTKEIKTYHVESLDLHYLGQI